MVNEELTTPLTVIRKMEDSGYKRDFLLDSVLGEKAVRAKNKCLLALGCVLLVFVFGIISCFFLKEICGLVIVTGFVLFLAITGSLLLSLAKKPKCPVCQKKMKRVDVLTLGADCRRMVVCEKCRVYADTYTGG